MALFEINDYDIASRRLTTLMGDNAAVRRVWIEENVHFTLEDDFKASAMELLHDLYTLKNHMADYGVEVTDEDKAAIEKAAAAFFKGCIGTERKVLFEELYEEKQIITGYTDNYIRVYVRYENEADARKLLEKFVTVKLTGLYGEGMTAEIQ